MFGISFEHLLVLGIILLFVGPRRLPELGNTLGKAIKNFKDGIGGVENATYRKLDDEETATPRAEPVEPGVLGTTPEEKLEPHAPHVEHSDATAAAPGTDNSDEKVAEISADDPRLKGGKIEPK